MKRRKPDRQDRHRMTLRLDQENHNFIAAELERLGLRSFNAALNVVLTQARTQGSKRNKRK
jgi:hypothetical protein